MIDDPNLRALGAELLGQSLARLASAADDALPAPLRVPRALGSDTPSRLAQRASGAATTRAALTQGYGQCLAHFRRAIQPADAADDDLGLACAHFVLANLAVLQGGNFDARQLAAVERQMRALLAPGPVWAQATTAQRQAHFEEFAILGVAIGESHAHDAKQKGRAGPGDAQRRQAAVGYLHQLLGVAPDALTLTAQGLAMAAPASVEA